MLENRFPCTSHICKNRLPEIPSQELVGHTVRIRRIATDEIKSFTAQALGIVIKHHDFVVILFWISMRNRFTHYTHIRVHRKKVLIK